MNALHPLQSAWRTYWVLKKNRPEPAWARLALTTALGLCIGVVLVTLVGLFSGNLGRWIWWRYNLAANLVVCLCISYTIHGLYRSVELLLSESTLQRIIGWRDWRAGVLFSMLGVSGALLGGLLGLAWISLLFKVDAWAVFAAQPRAISNFLVITALITLVNWFYWRWHTKRQALQLQATESQLRLLQAQIEPHFLFNTLANVHSLMDYEPSRAKAMLEAFTDYLRSSLGQLRTTQCTVSAELDMVKSYLLLMQIRMGERLRYEIKIGRACGCSVGATAVATTSGGKCHTSWSRTQGGGRHGAHYRQRARASPDNHDRRRWHGQRCAEALRPSWQRNGARQYSCPTAHPLWRKCLYRVGTPPCRHTSDLATSSGDTPMTTALLADDEPHLALYLKDQLKKLWPELEVLHIARNGIEAAEELRICNQTWRFWTFRCQG